MSIDAVAVAPDVYKVVFENDRVRVLEVRADPGAASPMHGHPDSVMHAVVDAHIVVTSPDGGEQRVDVPSGATFWNGATVHAVRNVGEDAVHFVRVELK